MKPSRPKSSRRKPRSTLTTRAARGPRKKRETNNQDKLFQELEKYYPDPGKISELLTAEKAPARLDVKKDGQFPIFVALSQGDRHDADALFSVLFKYNPEQNLALVHEEKSADL